MESRIAPDIIILEPNLKGNDYILGDIHGYKNTLEKVINILTPADRLFIVGDLTDRGPDNVEVIEMLAKLKANPNGPKIFVTTGNHEQFCINTIVSMETIFEEVKKEQAIEEAKRQAREKTKQLEQAIDEVIEEAKKELAIDETKKQQAIEEPKNEQAILDETLRLVKKAALEDEDVLIHSQDGNGGKWLQQLFLDEIANKKIFIENETTCYTKDSKIHLIERFLSPLPFIIRVKGGANRLAFNVVHADMPINDEELLRRINLKKPFLTPAEKEYATWAREDEYLYAGKHPYSTLTYVGHSIVIFDSPSVREKTNTINLDFGNYTCKVSCLANHTTHQTFAVLGEHSTDSIPFIPIPEITSDEDGLAKAERQKLSNELKKLIRPCWQIKSGLTVNESTLASFCDAALDAQQYLDQQQYYQKTATFISKCTSADDIDTFIAQLSANTGITYPQAIQLIINNDYQIHKILIKDLLDILQRRAEFARTQRLRLFDLSSLQENHSDELSEAINLLKQLLDPKDTLHLDKAGTCFTTHLK